MGGLWSRMRVTAITFLIATLAISGIIPLAGFWSKDDVLAAQWLSPSRWTLAIQVIHCGG